MFVWGPSSGEGGGGGASPWWQWEEQASLPSLMVVSHVAFLRL